MYSTGPILSVISRSPERSATLALALECQPFPAAASPAPALLSGRFDAVSGSFGLVRGGSSAKRGFAARSEITTKDTHIMEDKEGGACVDKDEVREHCMEFVLSNEVSIRVARTTPIQI